MAKKAKKSKKQTKKSVKNSTNAAKKTVKKSTKKSVANKGAVKKKTAKSSAKKTSLKKASKKSSKRAGKSSVKKSATKKAFKAPAKKAAPYRPPVARSKAAKKALASTAIGAAIPVPALELKLTPTKAAQPRKSRASKPARVIEMPADIASNADHRDDHHDAKPKHGPANHESHAQQGGDASSDDEQPRDLFEPPPSQEPDENERWGSDQDDMR